MADKNAAHGAVKEFAKRLRNGRSKFRISRPEFAGLVQVNVLFIKAIEHERFPRNIGSKRSRECLVKITNAKIFPEQTRQELYRLVEVFCPAKRKRFKIHFPFHIVSRRHRLYHG